MSKKIVQREEMVFNEYSSYSREKVIEMMDEALKKLTPEEAKTASFNVQSVAEYSDISNGEFFIRYIWIENDEEYKKRLEQQQRATLLREKYEKEQYEILRKKFGDK